MVIFKYFSLFSKSLVSFGGLLLSSQITQSFSSGLIFFLKYASLSAFPRFALSLNFSSSLLSGLSLFLKLSFESFVPSSQSLYRRLAPCIQLL